MTPLAVQPGATQLHPGTDPAAVQARAAQAVQSAPAAGAEPASSGRGPAVTVSAPAGGQDPRNDPRNQDGEKRDAQGLTEEERRVVRELRKKDQEVRQHERAHRIAGGQYTSPPSYEYQRGPDGKLYAVDGEVKIDTSEEASPEATIRKMEIVIRAALAPSDPSAQDRQVAAEARQKKQEAQAELRREKRDEDGAGSPLEEFRNQVREAITAYRKASEATPAADGAAPGRELAGLALEA